MAGADRAAVAYPYLAVLSGIIFIMQPARKEWILPGAIIFAGIILAVAIFVTQHHIGTNTNGNPKAALPVSTNDHVLGKPTAPIVVIEYADIDSPYAKDFQQVMEEVMQKYGSNGNVAWVFRHFPFASDDPNAEEHAEAAECVAAEGGSDGFFGFIDAMQAAAPGDNIFDPKGYDTLVQNLGLSTGSFDTCLTAHTYKKAVQTDYDNAIAVGATGSPYSIIEIKGQAPIVIAGSVPYSTMEKIIDTALANQLQSK